MSDNIEKKENVVLSFFKNTARDIISKPHSLARGFTMGAAIGCGLYAIQQEYITNYMMSIQDFTPYAYSLLTVLGGIFTRNAHVKGETLNQIENEVYPYMKPLNVISEWVVTGATALTTIAGIAANIDTGVVDKKTALIATGVGIIGYVTPKAFNFLSSDIELDLKISALKQKLSQPEAI